MKSVAVIGAGPSGICAARHLAARPSAYSCCVFEQASQLGGTWVLSDPADPKGAQSSMYKGLRTNLPKELMAFPDFPFPERPESYVVSEVVREYLESYVDHFQLRDLIKLKHRVDWLEPRSDGGWSLKVKDESRDTTQDLTFDAVIVAIGRYSVPSVPKLPGCFLGLSLHSHDYREPAPFSGQRVLVVGAGFSGLDLALDLASTAAQVTLSQHSPIPLEQQLGPVGVRLVPDVKRLEEHGAIFTDGSSAEFDVILYCTGYEYYYPFLSEACGVTTSGYGVEPLYQQLVHMHWPTLCFLVLQSYVVPFPLADLQVRFFLKLMEGSLKLPSLQEMQEEAAREQVDRRAAGLGPRHAHKMGYPRQGQYYETLARLADITPIPPEVANLHETCTRRIARDLLHFRDAIFRVVQGSIQEVEMSQ